MFFIEHSQFDAEAKAAALVRMANGAYSAGRSQGIASKPTAKKKLNRKSMRMATIPALLLPLETVPARIAMHAPWPTAAKSISLRRPRRSIIQIGTREDRKYATPLNPANSRDKL